MARQLQSGPPRPMPRRRQIDRLHRRVSRVAPIEVGAIAACGFSDGSRAAARHRKHPVSRQQFLKSTTRTAGAGVFASELFAQHLVAMDYAQAAHDARFRRIAATALALVGVKAHRVFVRLAHGTSPSSRARFRRSALPLGGGNPSPPNPPLEGESLITPQRLKPSPSRGGRGGMVSRATAPDAAMSLRRRLCRILRRFHLAFLCAFAIASATSRGT